MKFGRNTTLSYGVDLCAVEQGRIEIADDVYLGPRCILSSHVSIAVSKNCLFGLDVKIFDNNHAFEANHGAFHDEHVSIESNCWLGESVIALRSLKIGDSHVVGAG